MKPLVNNAGKQPELIAERETHLPEVIYNSDIWVTVKQQGFLAIKKENRELRDKIMAGIKKAVKKLIELVQPMMKT